MEITKKRVLWVILLAKYGLSRRGISHWLTRLGASNGTGDWDIYRILSRNEITLKTYRDGKSSEALSVIQPQLNKRQSDGRSLVSKRRKASHVNP